VFLHCSHCDLFAYIIKTALTTQAFRVSICCPVGNYITGTQLRRYTRESCTVLCLRSALTFQLLVTMEFDFDFGTGFAGASHIVSCFRTFPVNNTVAHSWSAVVSCKEGWIQLHETQCSVVFYLPKAVRIFDSRLVTNWKPNKRQSVKSVPQQATTWDKRPPPTMLRPRLFS
jgi:hypothetical protein